MDVIFKDKYILINRNSLIIRNELQVHKHWLKYKDIYVSTLINLYITMKMVYLEIIHGGGRPYNFSVKVVLKTHKFYIISSRKNQTITYL